MATYRSHRASDAPSLFPSCADKDTSLSAPNKAILSSLESINDYIQKHFDQFVANETLERSRLVASFAEKERNYTRQTSALKAIHTDIAGLLARERAANGELRDKLDSATNFVTRLCQVVADANFVLLHRKQAPHEIKQEKGSREGINVSDIAICPDAVISSLLSQIETIVTEINAQNGSDLPSPVDASPRNSITGALGKVVDSLLTTQRAFALLQEGFKSVEAARADTGRQNESLREKVALLQEELKQATSDNERISQELTAARLEKEKHICRPPAPACPTPGKLTHTPRPAAPIEFHPPLPSPPLEKRDSRIPDDILHDTCKIRRKSHQTFSERILPENTPLSSQTPIVKARPSSESAPTNCERRRISFSDAVKRVQTNPASSTMQSGPLESPIVRDDQQTAGPSMLPPPTPIQGIKRTLSGAHKCQDVSDEPLPSLSTSASSSSSISSQTNGSHPHKKRRLNVTPRSASLNQTQKSMNENNPPTKSDATHTSTPSTTCPSASSSKHTAVQLPKTSASDLKSLKFNKKSSKPPPNLTMGASSNPLQPIATPTKSDRPSMRPLDLAKKSPQERAALRKSK